MLHEQLFEYLVLASSFILIHHGVQLYTEKFVTKFCAPNKCEWMYLFFSALIYTAVIRSVSQFSSKVFSFN